VLEVTPISADKFISESSFLAAVVVGRDERLKPYNRMQVRIVRVIVFLFSEIMVSASLGGTEGSDLSSEDDNVVAVGCSLREVDSKNGFGVFCREEAN
jgi:hypothetical protein